MLADFLVGKRRFVHYFHFPLAFHQRQEVHAALRIGFGGIAVDFAVLHHRIGILVDDGVRRSDNSSARQRFALIQHLQRQQFAGGHSVRIGQRHDFQLLAYRTGGCGQIKAVAHLHDAFAVHLRLFAIRCVRHLRHIVLRPFALRVFHPEGRLVSGRYAVSARLQRIACGVLVIFAAAQHHGRCTVLAVDDFHRFENLYAVGRDGFRKRINVAVAQIGFHHAVGRLLRGGNYPNVMRVCRTAQKSQCAGCFQYKFHQKSPELLSFADNVTL